MLVKQRSSQLKRKDQQVRDQSTIALQDQAVEEVKPMSYLGRKVGQTAKVKKEVAVRLKKASEVYQMWRKVFRSHNLSKATKTLVFLMVLTS